MDGYWQIDGGEIFGWKIRQTNTYIGIDRQTNMLLDTQKVKTYYIDHEMIFYTFNWESKKLFSNFLPLQGLC